MFTQCTSTRTDAPLSTYLHSFSAQQAAYQAKITHGRDLVPYLCDRCNYWHLCPEERHTPSEKCHYCTSSDLKPKQLYHTHESAKKRAECLLRDSQLKLFVYACPHQHGWHLTKSNGL